MECGLNENRTIQIVRVHWKRQTTSLDNIRYFKTNERHLWLQAQYYNMLTFHELHFVSNAEDSICHFYCWSLLVYRVTSINDMQPFQFIMIFKRANHIYILIGHHLDRFILRYNCWNEDFYLELNASCKIMFR